MNSKQTKKLQKLIAEIEGQTILFDFDNWPKYQQTCVEWGDKVAPFLGPEERRKFNCEFDTHIRALLPSEPFLDSYRTGAPKRGAFNKMKGIANQKLQELELDLPAIENMEAIHLPSKVTIGWLFRLFRRLSIGSWFLLLSVVAGAYALGQGQEKFLRFLTTTFQNQQRTQSSPVTQTTMTTAKIKDIKRPPK
jgi:hypothetical protein